MNFKECRLWVVFIMLMSITVSFAQSSDSNYADLLKTQKQDTKRIYLHENTKDILKIEPFQLLDGRLPLIFEHRFKERYSISIAPGLLFPYDFYDTFNMKDLSREDGFFVTSLSSINPKFYNPSLGFSLYLEPRFYSKSWYSSYNSLFVGLLHYPNLNVLEVGCSRGYCLDFGRIHCEYSIKLSYVSQKLLNDETEYKFLPYLTKVDEEIEPNLFKLSICVQLGYVLSNIRVK